MAGGRKARWRRGESGAAAVQHLDDKVLKERLQQLEKTNQLFTLDAEGTDGTKHLSHGARRLLQRRQLLLPDSSSSSSSSSSKRVLLEVASEGHKKQLLRIIKGRKQRLEAQAKRKAHEAAAKSVDLWADESMTTTAAAAAPEAAAAAAAGGARKKRRYGLEDLRKMVPAVVLPGAEASYNPTELQQQQQLIAAAAAAVLQTHEGRSAKTLLRGCMRDKEQQLQWQQQLLQQQQDSSASLQHKQPLTAALLPHLGAEAVAQLTAEEKQRLVMELAVKGSISTDTPAEAASAEGDEDEEQQQTGRGPVKQPKKKTRADRNRQRRHEQQLRRAAAKQQRKALNKSIDRLPELLQQLKEQQQQQEETRSKREAGEEAKAEAARRGIVSIKIGRKRFIGAAAATDAALPGETTGSLRSTKVLSAAAAAVDRMRSIHRRGLLELPPELTAAHATRMKKQLRKTKTSRKLLKKRDEAAPPAV